MPAKKPRATAKRTGVGDDVAAILLQLKRLASPRIRDEMATRYGIVVDNALGVPMGAMIKLAKSYAPNHELAIALWTTGGYEARIVAAMVDDPKLVTPVQMERWCRDFDNWGIVDTVCFKLFDRSPHAWRKVEPWSRKRGEFQKRAGFVLMACLAAHDKQAPDESFIRLLPLIERGAEDERNFVKKGVSWALRMIGRRNRALRAVAIEVARRLATSANIPSRWVGKDALRDLR